MARQADIQYVEYHVEGNTARKVERNTMKNSVAPAYTPRWTERKVIALEPVAVIGIVLAVVMLVAMMATLLQYRRCLQQTQQMGAYLQQLQQENEALSKTYRESYDPDEIMKIALEAGMVPAESVETVRIMVEEPRTEEPQMSFWQSLSTFLAGIFA